MIYARRELFLNIWMGALIVHENAKLKKTVSVLTRLPSSLSPWRSPNWLNGCGTKTFVGEDCWDGFTQTSRDKQLLRCRGRGCYVLLGIVRMILWKGKSEKGRWKVAKVEEYIFSRHCRIVGCENEGAPTIL